MKTYKCHKVVEAALVVATDYDHEAHHVVAVCDDGGSYPAPNGLSIDKLVGGYLVSYKDGYFSWSPKEAFEEGYTEVVEPKPTKKEKK